MSHCYHIHSEHVGLGVESPCMQSSDYCTRNASSATAAGPPVSSSAAAPESAEKQNKCHLPSTLKTVRMS